MKLTRKQLYNIFQELKPNQTQYPDIKSILPVVAENIDVEPDEALKNAIKSQLSLFKRFCQSDRAHSLEEKFKKLEPVVVLDSDNFTPKPQVSLGVEIRKKFINVGRVTRLDRTQPLVDALDAFVENDGDISVPQLLGYLLYRTQYMKNRKLSELGCNLFNQTDIHNDFNLDEAIAVMHSLVLTKEQLRLMQNILKSKNVHFPNTTELLEARKRLRPTISATPDSKGVMVDYETLVRQTIEAQILQVEREPPFSCEDKIEVTLKDGCDGAGSQTVMKSVKTIESAPNMFVYGIVSLNVKVNDSIVWKNSVPNSPECLRPVYLIREKESDPVLLDYVIHSTDAARDRMNENGMVVNINGVALDVSVVMKDTMKDLKLKRCLSGLGGAACIICATKKDDWMNEELITQGFAINRSAEDTLRLYQSLVDEDGNIPSKPKDFQVRQGLTQKPISTSDQHSITITHSYINVTTWFLKLLYRLNQSYHVWRESKTVLGDFIRKGKDKVFETILNDTGMALDVVQQSNAHGGTTTNGNSGRRFFSTECIDSIKSCTKEKYHKSLLRLHLLLSAILRVISSQHRVNLAALEQVCLEASLLIATDFKWVNINHTLHGVLHHACELIALNDGFSLGSLSEEGLEASNKHIRKYLESHARKTSNEDQMVDVMTRLLERSHPCVLKNKMNFIKRKKLVQCLECGATTHSTSMHKSGPLTEIDALIESLLF